MRRTATRRERVEVVRPEDLRRDERRRREGWLVWRADQRRDVADQRRLARGVRVLTADEADAAQDGAGLRDVLALERQDRRADVGSDAVGAGEIGPMGENVGRRRRDDGDGLSV